MSSLTFRLVDGSLALAHPGVRAGAGPDGIVIRVVGIPDGVSAAQVMAQVRRLSVWSRYLLTWDEVCGGGILVGHRLTPPEAAPILECTPQQVGYLIRNGTVPAEQVGQRWAVIREDLAHVKRAAVGRPYKPGKMIPAGEAQKRTGADRATIIAAIKAQKIVGKEDNGRYYCDEGSLEEWSRTVYKHHDKTASRQRGDWWSQAQDQRLTAMANEGNSNLEIATALGKTPAAVRTRRTRLKKTLTAPEKVGK